MWVFIDFLDGPGPAWSWSQLGPRPGLVPGPWSRLGPGLAWSWARLGPRSQSVVPGPGPMVPGPWSLVPVRGPWSLAHGPWSWSLVRGPGPWSMVPGPWSLVHGPWYMVPGTRGPPEPWVFHQSAPYESYGGIRTTIRRRISIRIILDGSRVQLKPSWHRKLKKSLKVFHQKS